MLNTCQKDGRECGNLLGARCTVGDFFVTADFFRKQMKVGCQSFKEKENGRINDVGRETTAEVQKLPEQRVGTGRDSEQGRESERGTTVSMPVLQAGDTHTRDAGNEGQAGRNMSEFTCCVCGEASVINHNGYHYCYNHYMKRLESVSHERMMEKIRSEKK